MLVNVHYNAGIGQPLGTEGPKVQPGLLMQRLHRFLPEAPELSGAHGMSTSDLRAARLYCATGIEQQCLLHVLGVPQGSHVMQRFRSWQLRDLCVRRCDGVL